MKAPVDVFQIYDDLKHFFPSQFSKSPLRDLVPWPQGNGFLLTCIGTCQQDALTSLTGTIQSLAHIALLDEDVTVPKGTATTAAAYVNQVWPTIPGNTLRADAIDDTTVRLSYPELPRDLTTIEAALKAGTTGGGKAGGNGFGLPTAVVPIPTFCIPQGYTDSNGLSTSTQSCKQGELRARADIADADLTKLNSSSHTLALSPSGNSIIVTCKTACDASDISTLSSRIDSEAHVSLNSELLPVPIGTAATTTTFVNKYWQGLDGGDFRATAIGDAHIRLTYSNSSADVDILRNQIAEMGFGNRFPPLTMRMFTQNAGNVVSSLNAAGGGSPGAAGATGPAGAAGAAGATGAKGATGASGARGATGAMGPPAASPTTPNPAGAKNGNAGAAAQKDTTGPGGASDQGGPTATANLTITNSGNSGSANDTGAAGGSGKQGAPGNSGAQGGGGAKSASLGSGLAAVGNDNIVFTDTSDPENTKQQIRLLTMLDLPRPEVLMNLWSLQASSPNGRQVQASAERIRDAVEANNDALEHSIQYGWAYLSTQMKSKGDGFFDERFHNYITKRYVADISDCEITSTCALDKQRRTDWDICAKDHYCLGYTHAFDPVRPTLTSILLGMMASKDSVKTVLTTIACMEGKYEVYPECFADRAGIWGMLSPKPGSSEVVEAARDARRLETARARLLKEVPASARTRLGCETLDLVALEAQKEVRVAQTFPMTCFTVEAAKTFFPDYSFTTFSLDKLNELAERPIANTVGARDVSKLYSTTPGGLLRSAVANFLFNYKMAVQYPNDFGTYSLSHSAQELNALFNPLVVAFNQDVEAYTRFLMDSLQAESPNRNHWYQLGRQDQSFLSNGVVTVRGVSGVESIVDTTAQSYLDATQAVSLSQFLQNIGVTSSSVSKDLSGPITAAWAAKLLAATAPTTTTAQIGRQLKLDITPRTLAGASSADLQAMLTIADTATPVLYTGGTGSTSGSPPDPLSHVATHTIQTTVRVESIKLFDVSSFAAMVQRPRAKFPLLPPFVEIPFIGTLAGVPLPVAREYHRSTAIVSAIIVPTAADLGYGIEFVEDQGVIPVPPGSNRSKGFKIGSFTSQSQLRGIPIFRFHERMVECLARPEPKSDPRCGTGGALRLSEMPPDQ